MNNKKFVFCLLSIFLFTQCKKDEHECETIEQLSTMTGDPLYEGSPIFQKYPHFNPNNSDEIIFISHSQDNYPNSDLVRYNLESKERIVIIQGYFTGKPRWGKNDWILMQVLDNDGYNVYKIKSNGDNLTQLSPTSESGSYFDPLWNFTNENILYRLSLADSEKYILTDVEGGIIDTLSSGGQHMSSWQHPKYMASGTMQGLLISNPLVSEEFEYLFELPDQPGAPGAEWLDEERIIWCHMTGVYVTNIVNRETSMIRENCNADFLEFPTYAPDINKVIFMRTERIKEKKRDEYGIQRASLYMMNPDGTEGETIDIELE